MATENDDSDHEHHPDAWDKHRDRFAPRRIKIHGHSLATWASQLIAHEKNAVHTALSIGLSSGESNSDIAHRVVGSSAMRGANGATELTRQHILRLGKGFLRKRRMGGSPESGSKGT